MWSREMNSERVRNASDLMQIAFHKNVILESMKQ